MDCRTAQLLASFHVANKSELDADQIAALEAHLRQCPQCAKLINRERNADHRFGRAMRAVAVPPDLKARIVARLKPQLPAWYRRRSWQVTLATAASLLLGVYLVITASRPSKLDLQGIVERQIQTPQKELFLAWAAKQGIDFAPEGGLNLDLLAAFGNRDLEEREVTCLLLFHPGKQTSAEVFVIRSGQFDWKELPLLFSGSGKQVEVLRDRNRPERIAYLVIYSTDSLEVFREHVSTS
jgi:hypothetical protein